MKSLNIKETDMHTLTTKKLYKNQSYTPNESDKDANCGHRL